MHLCIYVYVCICMCVHICVHVCMRLIIYLYLCAYVTCAHVYGRQRPASRCLPQSPPPPCYSYFLMQSLTEPRAYCLASLAGQLPLRILLSLYVLPNARITCAYGHTQLFTWVLRSWAELPMCAQQALDQLRYIPVPAQLLKLYVIIP